MKVLCGNMSVLDEDGAFLILGLGKTGLASIDWLRRYQSKRTLYTWDDQHKKSSHALSLSFLDDIPWHLIKAVVQSPGVPFLPHNAHPVTQQARNHHCPIISDLDLFSSSHKNSCIVGITGTNGKSTTTALTEHILKELGYTAVMGGNIGTPILTLPYLDKQHSAYVIELSSFQLEISSPLPLAVGAWINFSPDHLDWHNGLEAYQHAKRKLFMNTTSAVVGIDDPVSASIFERTRQTHPTLSVTTSPHQEANIRVTPDSLFENNQMIDSITNIPTLRGEHNHQNMGIAYGIARSLGSNPNQTVEAMRTFPGLPHRQEIVGQRKGVLFVNDSKATNAESTRTALKTYEGLHIFWIAGGRAKEHGIIPLLPLPPHIRGVFLIGEAMQKFASDLKNSSIPIFCSEFLNTALEEAYYHAQKDNKPSVVLLSPACASFDQFDNFEQRGDVFRSLVHNLG